MTKRTDDGRAGGAPAAGARRGAVLLVAALAFAPAALAQEAGTGPEQPPAPADVRQELDALRAEIERLGRELPTRGAEGAVAGDTLQRLDLIESELRLLTARTEELEFRMDRVAADAATRIGDLEFRICELEEACDTADLQDSGALGLGGAPAPSAAPDAGTELAVGERGDLERALAALEDGRAETAATLLEEFVETYPGGPLSSEAHYYRGQALAELGRDRDAGLAYLESFSGAPAGPLAADALLGLGASLGRLGQLSEACTTLGEIGARFPDSDRLPMAEEERARLGCS